MKAQGAFKMLVDRGIGDDLSRVDLVYTVCVDGDDEQRKLAALLKNEFPSAKVIDPSTWGAPEEITTINDALLQIASQLVTGLLACEDGWTT